MPTIDPLLTLDLRDVIDTASNYLPWQQMHRSEIPNNGAESTTELQDLIADTKLSRGDHLGLVRLLLSRYATFGIDLQCDQALVDHLEIINPRGSSGNYLTS